jgi:hypothetical protein
VRLAVVPAALYRTGFSTDWSAQRSPRSGESGIRVSARPRAAGLKTAFRS